LFAEVSQRLIAVKLKSTSFYNVMVMPLHAFAQHRPRPGFYASNHAPATADTTDYDIEGAEPGAETESDDEEVKNTVGNIPMEWYNDFPHIGYNLDGQKVMRPAKGDELDLFLEKMDNPDFWYAATRHVIDARAFFFFFLRRSYDLGFFAMSHLLIASAFCEQAESHDWHVQFAVMLSAAMEKSRVCDDGLIVDVTLDRCSRLVVMADLWLAQHICHGRLEHVSLWSVSQLLMWRVPLLRDQADCP
jgi:hypothetical protein